MSKYKLTWLSILVVSFDIYAQANAIETVTVIGKPIVEENIIDEFSSTASLVSAQQLRDQNAIDLAAALRTVPSVQISRFNPVGAFGGNEGGGVFIRGIGTSRPGSEIKTYIDGIPFYMGLWNHPLLDLLPLNGMQSIRVNKAPQVQTNGNNFASINLATKQADTHQIHGSVKLSGGEFNTIIQQAEISGGLDKLDFMLAQGYATSDGHRDNADGELSNIMGRLGYQVSERWKLSGFFLYTDNKASDPGDTREPSPEFAPRYDTKATVAALSIEHSDTHWQGKLQLYSNKGDGDWLQQPSPDGDTLSNFEMQGFRWHESLSLWDNSLLVLGADYDEISGDIQFNRISPAPRDTFDAPTFRITSPYLSFSHEMRLNDTWSIRPSAAIRYYQHSEFNAESAPQFGLSLASEHATIFANFSTGINYPGLEVTTLAHLIPALGNTWQTLEAETLDHSEIGINFHLGSHTQIDLAIFENTFSSRYIFGFPPLVPPPPQFINLGGYTTQGAELALTQQVSRHWSVFAGISLLDPSLENIPYSPEESASLGLNGKWQQWRISLDAQYQSAIWSMNQSRSAGDTQTQRVPSFAVANARFAYDLPSLGDKGEVFIALENLGDRAYSYRPGYEMPGRWLQLGIGASF